MGMDRETETNRYVWGWMGSLTDWQPALSCMGTSPDGNALHPLVSFTLCIKKSLPGSSGDMEKSGPRSMWADVQMSMLIGPFDGSLGRAIKG